MRIGICGGTFDPFHRGHLDPVLAVREAMRWDRVIYIPAAVQPFKRDAHAESGYHRFAMAVLATQAHEGMLVSAMELERADVSYSVATLRELRGSMPDATLDWIIGDDNLAGLVEWKSIDAIFELANFAVLTRGGSRSAMDVPQGFRARVTPPAERAPRGAIVFAENDVVPVSSTEIRARVRAGDSIADLVSAPVSRYIDRNGLYRKGSS